LFAVIGVIALFFVITQVSETRGRSLGTLEEDVETSGYSTSGEPRALAVPRRARTGRCRFVGASAGAMQPVGGASQVKGAYGVAARWCRAPPWTCEPHNARHCCKRPVTPTAPDAEGPPAT
jgi:hypothetical protein